ncbi:hypothetical protein C1H46_014850 [Malus baccata]|uniref:Exostosin GT47 domain-containing protein n=1 Tax=Malus baccata TaxID=106549 RepID=A0A540ML74_MALBA|nr:hypothetical protein C1H46_014850 [Malus baccata]
MTWGPCTTSFVSDLFHNSIRVLCNANTSKGFNPSKDASLPEINLKTSEMSGIGGQPHSKRSTLAFFAGGLHDHIGYLLLKRMEGQRPRRVYDKLYQGVLYENMLRSSKFCLCPSGYEVASPRVVEAIYAECVPVLISDTLRPFCGLMSYSTIAWTASIHKGVQPDVAYGYKSVSMPGTVFNFFTALGDVAFAYADHNVVLEIQATIPSTPEKPSKKPMWRGVVLAYIVVALC